MSSGGDSRNVPRSHATQALAKSLEFAQSAQSALGSQRWNSAGLDAVHAGIAAADAVLIAVAGIRSVSRDHGAVIGLLDSRVPAFGPPQRRQLAGLLKMKNQVAYEQRLLTQTEARQLVDHATRLAKWAAGIVADRPA